ncbi:peptide ABC transporter permease, partial [Leptolyngbya sp. 'hensonii']|uniref:ShlB/FhaC/HecB family hemolysin secretion/activation protein n=1 Tax=Leptolyngbya sp. 'hensonii' TaxID=1922337 RepID=UPI000963D856
SVVKLGQDYVARDSQGAWGLRSQFNMGTGLFDATSNPAPIPSGQFFSWSGQVQRLQVLDSNHLLMLQGEVQLSADPLLPSQQFVIGGGQSVRGYRQNARSGDNGFRVAIEDRITVARDGTGGAAFQVAPFMDMGAVWNSGPLPLPRNTFLSAVGVGLLWNPDPALDVRLDYAMPFINLSDRGNNIQDGGLHFRINTRF